MKIEAYDQPQLYNEDYLTYPAIQVNQDIDQGFCMSPKPRSISLFMIVTEAARKQEYKWETPFLVNFWMSWEVF